jgi:hypothetical protein
MGRIRRPEPPTRLAVRLDAATREALRVLAPDGDWSAAVREAIRRSAGEASILERLDRIEAHLARLSTGVGALQPPESAPRSGPQEDQIIHDQVAALLASGLLS